MNGSRLIVDCGGLEEPNLATIDGLTRLQLAAKRRGWGIELRRAHRPLLELIAFAGLAGTLCVESGGQAEEGEKPRRVEEESELHDPPV